MRKRFRWSDKNQKFISIDEWVDEAKNAGFFIQKDIEPYQSMIDGSMINSRSHHRNHLRQHGCIEVGNDSSVVNPKRRPLPTPPGLKESIIRAVDQQMRKR